MPRRTFQRRNNKQNAVDDDKDDDDDKPEPLIVEYSESSAYDDDTDYEGASTPFTNSDSNLSNHDDDDDDDEYAQVERIARSETRMVYISKWCVFLSILGIGAAVSTLTYVNLHRQVRADSRDAFQLFANTIHDNSQFQVHAIFQSCRALSRAITTSAATTSFPLFQIPAFEAHAYEARIQAGMEVIQYAPVVRVNLKQEWIDFSSATHADWIVEGRQTFDVLQPGFDLSKQPVPDSIPPFVWNIKENATTFQPLQENGGLFVPTYQTSPPPLANYSNWTNINMFSVEQFRQLSLASVTLKDAVFSEFGPKIDLVDTTIGSYYHQVLHDTTQSKIDVWYTYRDLPHSIAAQPIYKTLSVDSSSVVGYLYSVISWDSYLVNLLPKGVNGILVVLRNSCNQSVTFELRGDWALFLGEGDHSSNNNNQRIIDFSKNYFDPNLTAHVPGHCQIFLHVTSSATFEQQYASDIPMIFTATVAAMFLLMALIFFAYDRFVQIRNDLVTGVAARSNAIISSLFPSNVKDQLLAAARRQEEDHHGAGALKGFLQTRSDDDDDDSAQHNIFETQPIADLYPATTIMFGDIVGFTAWSSVREPAQVFTLLETVYHSFDEIAKRRRIFKVETVGDCYVAVCGLPEPRPRDHAVNMARFARDCLHKMWTVTKKLEVLLGPDTGELTLRIGLHSGPVTAGVLRGERSRFQLFGDTMNTASRMESNGLPNKIQLSQETTDLLIEAGKSNWIKPREDKIHAKGKGDLQTYWMMIEKSTSSSNDGSSGGTDDELLDIEEESKKSLKKESAGAAAANPKTLRLVEWNVEVLGRLLKQIVARRSRARRSYVWRNLNNIVDYATTLNNEKTTNPLDEVQEIIRLPHFDGRSTRYVLQQQDHEFELDPQVYQELEDYVLSVSFLYRDNPFHNFEHASHVTMSVCKLLNRIVAPSDNDLADSGGTGGGTIDSLVNASSLHDHTYGITSDPLTQFACVFSALIHDLDHPGVPNAQLVKEGADMAKAYKNQSVAEQNSVDLAWGLLLDPKYDALRSTIYATEIECKRFRQLVVNSVMATDIVDKELKALRNARWDKAFTEKQEAAVSETRQDSINRKATIVIEHLIQASDVAHTMQHWHIYRKWNERFFCECYKAYLDGRANVDPSIHWYKGEIGFFDFYIIPLAKKLRECGVFGVSSDEYLNYALKNRKEWENRGQEVTQEMIAKVHAAEMGSRQEEKQQPSAPPVATKSSGDLKENEEEPPPPDKQSMLTTSFTNLTTSSVFASQALNNLEEEESPKKKKPVRAKSVEDVMDQAVSELRSQDGFSDMFEEESNDSNALMIPTRSRSSSSSCLSNDNSSPPPGPTSLNGGKQPPEAAVVAARNDDNAGTSPTSNNSSSSPLMFL